MNSSVVTTRHSHSIALAGGATLWLKVGLRSLLHPRPVIASPRQVIGEAQTSSCSSKLRLPQAALVHWTSHQLSASSWTTLQRASVWHATARSEAQASKPIPATSRGRSGWATESTRDCISTDGLSLILLSYIQTTPKWLKCLSFGLCFLCSKASQRERLPCTNWTDDCYGSNQVTSDLFFDLLPHHHCATYDNHIYMHNFEINYNDGRHS